VHPHFFVPKLGLSLYLMTQCQVKLHHPVTSLAQTLDYIEVSAPFVRRRCDCLASSAPFINIQTYLLTYIEVSRQQVDEKFTLDQLLLKLTERKILGYIFCSL